MKKIITVLSLVIVIITSCKPTKNEAIRYNDIIMNVIDSLSTDHTLLLNQIDGHNLDSLKIAYHLFLKKSEWSIERSKNIGMFANDKEFIAAARDYFITMYTLGNNEVKQMVEIMTKDNLEVTQKDIDQINKLAITFDNVYGKVYEKVLAAQVKFSKEWGFILEEAK